MRLTRGWRLGGKTTTEYDVVAEGGWGVAHVEIQRREGASAWLLVGLLVVAFAALPLWIRFGGSPPGSLPPMPGNPIAILEGGQKIAFAAGDLSRGDGLLCESQGLRVGAWVPRRGLTSHSSVSGPNWTATIHIHARSDGVVIARCA